MNNALCNIVILANTYTWKENPIKWGLLWDLLARVLLNNFTCTQVWYCVLLFCVRSKRTQIIEYWLFYCNVFSKKCLQNFNFKESCKILIWLYPALLAKVSSTVNYRIDLLPTRLCVVMVRVRRCAPQLESRYGPRPTHTSSLVRPGAVWWPTFVSRPRVIIPVMHD